MLLKETHRRHRAWTGVTPAPSTNSADVYGSARRAASFSNTELPSTLLSNSKNLNRKSKTWKKDHCCSQELIGRNNPNINRRTKNKRLVHTMEIYRAMTRMEYSRGCDSAVQSGKALDLSPLPTPQRKRKEKKKAKQQQQK